MHRLSRSGYILWLVLSFLPSYHLQAQLTNYYFTHLAEEDGLSDNTVFCALVDSRGYAWLGTSNGLNRWDGVNIKVFKSNPKDSTMLSSSTIKDLVEDQFGNIWIATVGGGLNRYNPIREQFEVFRADPDNAQSISGNNVVSLLLDADSVLWSGTFNDGFNRYDPETNTFKAFNLKGNFTNPKEAFKRNSVHDIIQDYSNKEILWIAGDDGLYKFNKTTEDIQWYPSSATGTQGMSVHQIWMDSPDALWVGTYGGGIAKVNPSNPEQWRYYPPLQAEWENRSAAHNIIFGLARKSKDQFWVSSFDQGCGIFNTRTRRYQFFKPSHSNRYSISSEKVNQVYIDPQDRVWVLHQKDGISIHDPATHLFNFEALPMGDCRSFSGGEITDFAFDSDNNRIYITGAACDGLFQTDPEFQSIQKIALQGFDNQYQIFNTVFKDSKGRIWVGGEYTRGAENDDFKRPSLLYYQENINRLIPFTNASLDQIPIQQHNVKSIFEDSRGNLWIGSDIGGLVQIHPGRDSVDIIYPPPHIIQTSSPISISQIIERQPGELWLSTFDHGIFEYNSQSNSWRHFSGNESDKLPFGISIHDFTVYQDSLLMLGTNGNGLQIVNLSDDQNAKVYSYTEEQGLNNGTIDQVLKDAEQNIWITTRKELTLFDYEHKRFIPYSAKNGLLDGFFYRNGLEQMPWGEVLVGSRNGFYRFHPDSLLRKDKAPKLVLTEFRIFEEIQDFEKNINYLDEIVLRHNQNYFSIGFSGLNYSAAETDQFGYFLEDYDPNWIFPRNNRKVATYTNIPPGRYTFRLKNNSPSGEEVSLQLSIRVLPPWYQTIWAYALYTLLVLLAIYLYNYYQKRRWQLKAQLQMEQAEARRLKELDTFKSRFYTNFTHEFRTPLTMVIGLADQIMENTRVKVTEKASTIKRNGRQLLDLINQILDLAKLEEGKLQPNYIQGDVSKFLNYLTQSLQSNAFSSGVTLACFTTPNEIVMDYDPEKLERILINLITNAIKFTPKYGSVKVIAQQEAQRLNIQVQDTGVGIKSEDQDKIFNRFYQSESANTMGKGSGIGLSLVRELVELMRGEISLDSTPGKGSTFTLSFPISNNAPIEDRLPSLESIPDKIHSEVTVVQPRLTKKAVKEQALVLIVEDNTDVTEYIKSLLENRFNLLEAPDGDKGKDMAFDEIPDLIISDVMMPGLNGLQLCELLKKDERTCHIPIILLTGKSTVEERLEGLKHGADAYINKPFNKEELLIRVEKLIESRKILWKKYSNMTFLLEEEESNDLDRNFLRRVYNLIEENMEDPDFGTPQLCKLVFMSRTSLHRKLKALTGKPTANFIESVRLEKAKELLLNSEMSAKEITYAIGFKDPSQFSKSFKKKFGQTPSETRK
jgi:signal transduction histidine kinase/ligand-binding sensor domain-containing protein/CheY-like chemotaxis protein/AraC-like DNA-binding protein